MMSDFNVSFGFPYDTNIVQKYRKLQPRIAKDGTGWHEGSHSNHTVYKKPVSFIDI